MENKKINREIFNLILLDDSYIKWLDDFTIWSDEFDDLYFVKNNNLSSKDKLMIRFLGCFYNEVVVYAIKNLGYKLIDGADIGCCYDGDTYVVSFDGECHSLCRYENYKPEFTINYEDLKKQYDTENNIEVNSTKETPLDILIEKVLEKPEDFYKKISEALTPEERLFILKKLKNKCCENCTNGSCNVEYHEKVGIDKSGIPQGAECAGWINHEIIGKSKVLRLTNINDLKNR